MTPLLLRLSFHLGPHIFSFSWGGGFARLGREGGRLGFACPNFFPLGREGGGLLSSFAANAFPSSLLANAHRSTKESIPQNILILTLLCFFQLVKIHMKYLPFNTSNLLSGKSSCHQVRDRAIFFP